MVNEEEEPDELGNDFIFDRMPKFKDVDDVDGLDDDVESLDEESDIDTDVEA
jgi:hypothetical protein